MKAVRYCCPSLWRGRSWTRFANTQSSHLGRASDGFTLVEVLVAVGVLGLLVLMTAQLFNNATNVVTLSDKRIDSDSEAQLVFNRMEEDVNGMLRRADADCFFVKNTGNDAFYFYSQATGYYPGGEGPAAPYALVGYRISNRASQATSLDPNGVLERIGIGMGYDNSQTGKIMRFLTYPAPTVSTPTSLPLMQSTIAWAQGANGSPTGGNEIGTSPTWDNPPYAAANQAVLSSRVFRLEFCFQMNDGTYYVPPVPGDQPWSNSAFMSAMLNIRTNAVSLIVTIALLDNKSQLIVPQSTSNSPNLTTAIGALADGDTPAVATTWMNTVQAALGSPSASVATLGMPLAAASQIRVYQRSFRLMP